MSLFKNNKKKSKDELKQRKKELEEVNTRKVRIKGNRKKQEKLIDLEYERLSKMKENIFYFEASKTEVSIDKEFVRIVRKGISNKLTLGSSGEKAILISSITSIQLKKPKLSAGYIQFNLAGNFNSQGVLGATQDENSILFVVDEMDIALKVQSVIEQRLTEKQKTPEQISATDEICKYKELLNDGIITEVEFEKKKNSLLNN
ncbi:DUF4429 domain-containing protein [Listeria monocytogenes]|uniref:DUF4429 domain-containing protein n=1 Tax=Listeria monocytogenes TaxID=1639 RepID=UPI000D1DB618|nr:DUF4429 domain-containing protein [Listeria monocytogenes]AVV07492.1 hypothetical protein CXL08_11120 [Listeria monocytogenes]EAG2929031.1 DUF4429 domain-containing protein [Listeria monocytogenes]EJB6185366.1 DUF4429 domain-containing protein [Listeria monocytogenes]EJB6201348.1 DUF4429 domain-containing protein [Listeria monocytogenes]EJB6309369.1 DUF4429 domain-containing protein [Listeria monocytogenes]